MTTWCQKVVNYGRLLFLLGWALGHHVCQRISRFLPTGMSVLELDSSQRFGRLRFKFKGQMHTILLPYNIRHARKMREVTISAVFSSRPEIDITQPPGLPYLYSPTQIGADKFILRQGDETTECYHVPLSE